MFLFFCSCSFITVINLFNKNLKKSNDFFSFAKYREQRNLNSNTSYMRSEYLIKYSLRVNSKPKYHKLVKVVNCL